MKELTQEQHMAVSLFERHFCGRREHPLVLYGLGRNTEAIVQSCPEIALAGVMGPDADAPIWNGKKVLSDREAAALSADIVIVARNAVVPLIYRRISALEKKNVRIFRINGTRLGSGIGRWQGESMPCWKLTEEAVKLRIDAAHYISFDIFDTLLERRLLYPEDLFEEIERHFFSCHRMDWPVGAFSTVRRKAEKSVGPSGGIKAIYQAVQEELKLPSSVAAELLALEWELEQKTVCIRQDMIELFRYTEKKGKLTALLSDMFWPSENLRHLLDGRGLRTDVPILVSCELGCSKEDGGLYTAYFKQTGAVPEECLHIGDNRYADIEAAQQAGISACQILNGFQMLEASAAQTLLDHTDTFRDKTAVGKWIAEQFSSPFALHTGRGRVVLETPYELGHDFLGPLVDFWLGWLLEQLSGKNLNKMLFPSRDGFLPRRLYELLRTVEHGLPPSVYFNASRRSISVAAIRTEEDIQQIAARVFHGTTRDFFQRRFGIEFGDDTIWRPESQQAKKMLSDSSSAILKHAQKERDCYLAYLDGLGLPGEGVSGFFDFVAGGTVQHFYEQLTGSRTAGFYFAVMNLPNQFYTPEDIAAPFGNITSFGCSSPLAEHYIMLENVLTAPDTMLIRVAADGQMVYANGKNTAWPVMKQVQQGIFGYVSERLRRGERSAGEKAALGIFELLFDGSVIVPSQLRKWFVYEDDYDGAIPQPCWTNATDKIR